LSSNSLIISVGHNWIPPFQLTTLALGSCRVGPQFPTWLRGQRQINKVDLSKTSITSTLPHWLWSLPLRLLNLSYNNITGRLPAYLKSTIIPLPHGLEVLDLSNNSISGSLPKLLPTLIYYLSLSNNLISGSIPSSLCELASPEAIDLSGNNLSGEFPQCWQQDSWLQIINFSNNNIIEEIPPSIGSLTLLLSLDLGNNNFYGELPLELQHCKNLVLLDLGNNNFSGKLPIWIGEKLLIVYSIPDSGYYGASSMVLYVVGLSKFYKLVLVMKGKRYTYRKIPDQVRTIDLSGNNLSGNIPEEIGALGHLNSLNLSMNHLTGRIPEKIFDIIWLECLDLSLNKLSCVIPQSISKLTFLDHLNLSYNNLSGRIPFGNQLDTFDDPSIYKGNAYLCGPPSGKNCSGDQVAPTTTSNYVNGSEMIWLYLGMGLGFVFGFWIVCGILLFCTTWRNTYFQMIDYLFDKIYVTVAINMNKLNRKWR
ncbi:uncharacterized protein, partial [Typha angustifolia]|uniref:uncharacterized protein n=1 Tax=Typha angustifolia TaxID=59011 RepID=UPI003C2F8103